MYKELVERLKEWNERNVSAACECEHMECREYCESWEKGRIVEGDCIAVQAYTAIEHLQSELERVTRERDAAVEDIKHSDNCDVCKYSKNGGCFESDFDCETCKKECVCRSCRDESAWQWRGVTDTSKEG